MMMLKPILYTSLAGFCALALSACGSSSSSSSSSTSDSLETEQVASEQFESTISTDSNYQDLLISWEDNSDNEVEFIIERRLEENVDYGTVYYVAENTTTFEDQDVLTGENYCYRVSASNSYGESHSSEVCIAL